MSILVPRNRRFLTTAAFYSPLGTLKRRFASYTAAPALRCDIDAEPLHRYRPGGYHPVHLGDSFKNGRYKILHKIGWGGYSTTWVARDLLMSRNVAVKFSVSEKNDNHETHILQAISAFRGDHPGRAHLVQMLDCFIVDGPNGTHDCLVLELLGPSVQDAITSYKDHRLPAALAKSTAYQALQGLDLLSQHKISHADFHSGNVAFKLPDLDLLDEHQFFKKYGKPEISGVHSTDGAVATIHVPSYIVQPISLTGRAMRDSLSKLSVAKLIDFGESFFEGQSPAKIHTPLPVRAPEALFGDNLDCHVDIWSMGCLLFELVTGQPPFDSVMITPAILVSQMIEFSTDKLPGRWQEKWQAMAKTVSENDTPYTLQRWMEEIYFDDDKHAEFTNKDITKICELVGRMLIFEPSTRPPANEILQDPWFKS
ncbi:kinase-like protein [Nemania sp. NC0429]|nr:kinase-like protein [Nemania sp. NC0429]